MLDIQYIQVYQIIGQRGMKFKTLSSYYRDVKILHLLSFCGSHMLIRKSNGKFLFQVYIELNYERVLNT